MEASWAEGLPVFGLSSRSVQGYLRTIIREQKLLLSVSWPCFNVKVVVELEMLCRGFPLVGKMLKASSGV
jgi:hypothetical protein